MKLRDPRSEQTKTYLSRNEDRQWARQGEDTGRLNGGNNGIDLSSVSKNSQRPQPRIPSAYRLTTERLPDDRTISDGVFRLSDSRHHPPFANINHVHDTDHKVITCAPSLFLLVESTDEVLSHVGSEIGRVHRDHLGLFFEEKHRRGCGWMKMR